MFQVFLNLTLYINSHAKFHAKYFIFTHTSVLFQ